MNPNTVLWAYIVLLLVGGLFGFLKAGSKISLITSAVSAALLIVTTLRGIFQPGFRQTAAEIIMAALLVVFAIRLTKTKKFMPSGMMLALTIAAMPTRLPKCGANDNSHSKGSGYPSAAQRRRYLRARLG